VLRALGQFRRVMKGSGLLGKAGKLERRGRLPEARVALLEALETLEGTQGEVASSVRLPVVTGLARIAATMKDRVEAIGYIRQGLALWSEFRLKVPTTRKVETFTQWESWARAYLEAASNVPAEPTMKLDFIPDADPLARWSAYTAVMARLGER